MTTTSTLNGTAGSTTVQAIENAYEAVRANHPDLPEILFITGSGLMGTGGKWGHYGADRWEVRDGKLVDGETGALPEIFIAGERLECGAELTLATIIHEAVHALATVRGVKETSRGYRYHNKKFVALAEELGMEWPEGKAPHASIGFSAVVLSEATIERYADAIADLDAAIVSHLNTFKLLGMGSGKETEGEDGGETPAIPKTPAKKSTSNLKATCGCGRIIRASKAVLDAAGIECKECGEEFLAE